MNYKIENKFKPNGFPSLLSLLRYSSLVKKMVVGSFPVESVKHRPILTRAPRNMTVLIGSNITMTCEVLSDAHRHLEWYHGYHTSFDTINETNQSSRVEVKVGM